MFFFSVFTYINSIQNRAHSLNLDALGLPTHDLRELEMLISEEKVFAVIKEMSAKDAPGLDGFTEAFYP